MKEKFLRLYDKIILAALFCVLSFFGCARKSYSEKQREKSEQSADSIQIKNPGFDQEIIAMYGVRPTKHVE